MLSCFPKIDALLFSLLLLLFFLEIELLRLLSLRVLKLSSGWTNDYLRSFNLSNNLILISPFGAVACFVTAKSFFGSGFTAEFVLNSEIGWGSTSKFFSSVIYSGIFENFVSTGEMASIPAISMSGSPSAGFF